MGRGLSKRCRRRRTTSGKSPPSTVTTRRRPSVAKRTRVPMAPRLLKRTNDTSPPIVVRARLIRDVERDAIENPGVLRQDLRRDLVIGRRDGEDLEHLVRDLAPHARPIALRGLLVQAHTGLAPSVRLEDADVRPRRGVERDLHAYGVLGALHLGGALAGD